WPIGSYLQSAAAKVESLWLNQFKPIQTNQFDVSWLHFYCGLSPFWDNVIAEFIGKSQCDRIFPRV
ncbi:MAG: hypothetical protein AAFQ76_11550, partial [Cyanobacteria bacterium J06626_26]